MASLVQYQGKIFQQDYHNLELVIRNTELKKLVLVS